MRKVFKELHLHTGFASVYHLWKNKMRSNLWSPHKAEKVLSLQRTHFCFSTPLHKVLPPACARQLYLIRKHVLLAAQRRRSTPCVRQPKENTMWHAVGSQLKPKKVRAEEWVNWLRLSTWASASEQLRTHSPAPQPRQSRETQRQLCWCLSCQKSFPNQKLFHLPIKHYHVWEGNTTALSNSQHYDRKKNTAANIANGGTWTPPLFSIQAPLCCSTV